MSVNINSNISFYGNGFLDERQGLAKTISDLKDWDFEKYPIPLGFEICLNNGTWYTFGQDWSDSTGYFKERKTGGIEIGGGNEVSSISGIVITGDKVGEAEDVFENPN